MIADAFRSVWTAPRAPRPPVGLRRDWALVGVVVAAAVVETLLRPDVRWRAVALLLAVVPAALLPWRRRYPLAALAACLGTATLVSIAASAARVPGDVGLYTSMYALLLPYALFRWGSGRDAVLGSAIALAAYGVSIAKDHAPASDMIGGFVVLTLPAVLGLSMRFRASAWARDLEQARFRERELLARELHDTVAHHVSAMVIRAQAGRVVAGARPEAAVDALEIIEAEGSRTLAEMRAMVAALRDGDDAQLVPLGGIADIERLARSVDAGPDVQVSLSGVPGDVSPSVEAALYRIAQESVTNALRHARHATRIEVRLTGPGEQLRLIVRDDGGPVPAVRTTDGYGILGMTERAKLLGGTLTAGPRPDGGWTVEAVLPRAGAAG